MTTINLFDPIDGLQQIEYHGSIGDYVVEKFYGKGIAYSVYDGIPSNETDITFDIDKQLNGHGEYTILQTPSGGLEVATWVLIVSTVLSVAAIAFMPKVKLPSNADRGQVSPNNNLAGRTNTARPLQRVPDIKGTVRSVPDVLMQPYNRYFGQSNKVEIGLYCVGRGEYTLNDIRDGDTPIGKVEGASCEVYGPYKSKNNSSPDIPIGEPITEGIVIPYRSNSVNGVELIRYQLSGKYPITNTDTLGYSNSRVLGVDDEYRGYFTISLPGRLDDYSVDYYALNTITVEAGDIGFGNSIIFPTETTTFNPSGTHKLVSVEEFNSGGTWYVILVTDLWFDDSDTWVAIGGPISAWEFSMTTGFQTPYNDWYYMTSGECNRGFVNIVAPNGLYRDNGEKLFAVTIEYEMQIELLDAGNNDTGYVITQQVSISGSNSVRRGISVDFTLPYASKFKLRIARLTGRISGSGQVVDMTQLEDLYGLVDITKPHFGDVTTIMTRTLSTPFATAMKERKLNCLATERVYPYLGNGTFSNVMVDNSSAVQSYIKDFVDPVIGRRPLVELDADGLLAIEAEIDSYFGETNHHQFNYTLDSTDITFQEYTQMLFNAINCVAYRDGSIVRAHFERSGNTPSMLFTHRSKLPESETYTRNMNYFSLNDGIEFIWVNPTTDTQETIYIPADKSSTNPRKIEMPGMRDEIQATKRAWREYQKLIHEKVSVEVEVTAGGRYLKPGDVFSITKGTRTNTSDGEVLGVGLDGLTLTLSQDVTFTPGDTHSIILKKRDGTIQSIMCTEGAKSNQVLLASLPDEAVYTGIDSQIRTEFSFGNEARHLGQLFIARSIDVSARDSVVIRGINYTDAYYQYDPVVSNAFDDGYSNGYS